MPLNSGLVFIWISTLPSVTTVFKLEAEVSSVPVTPPTICIVEFKRLPVPSFLLAPATVSFKPVSKLWKTLFSLPLNTIGPRSSEFITPNNCEPLIASVLVSETSPGAILINWRS